MPAPAGLRAEGGAAPGLAEALARINAMLRPGGATLPVRFDLAEPQPASPALGDDESYRLELAPGGVLVKAGRICGARHALTTLAQLAVGAGEVPIGRIEDRPRFPWRGLMLDVARRFIGLAALLRVVDAMAFYKLNVLHLHLCDDQGFRLQSRAYPRLASRESYSAAELRELVASAGERGIRVVPELDMPGHATSWVAAYPGWAPRRPPDSSRFPAAQGNDQGADIGETPHSSDGSRRFGPHQAVLNVADEAVYRAIDNLFGELAEIFPDPYVHIGGDEVLPGWWAESAAIGAYMRRHGLGDAAALQAHFNAKVAALAASHGKRLIGWDEVLNGGAPAGMTVQAWRGATARDRALGAGHPCIDSAGYYLDLCFPADVHHGWDPEAAVAELLRREDALLEDPRFAHVAAGIKWSHQWRTAAAGASTSAAPEGAPSGKVPPAGEPGPGAATTGAEAGGAVAGVLGGEACLWSELVDERVLPVRLWSRMPAVAERLWSMDPPADAPAARLEASLDQLADAGLVAVRQTSRELLVEFGVAPTQLDVVELLEPIKWYGRLLGEQALAARIEGSTMPEARPYTTDTALNRPVDALLPESFAAKRFARLLDANGPALRGECARLRRICAQGEVLPDLRGPVGQLAELLETVLAVLDGRIATAAAQERVTAAAGPSGEYINAIAPSVQAWLTNR